VFRLFVVVFFWPFCPVGPIFVVCFFVFFFREIGIEALPAAIVCLAVANAEAFSQGAFAANLARSHCSTSFHKILTQAPNHAGGKIQDKENQPKNQRPRPPFFFGVSNDTTVKPFCDIECFAKFCAQFRRKVNTAFSIECVLVSAYKHKLYLLSKTTVLGDF
jgi:hypothetical protein